MVKNSPSRDVEVDAVDGVEAAEGLGELRKRRIAIVQS